MDSFSAASARRDRGQEPKSGSFGPGGAGKSGG